MDVVREDMELIGVMGGDVEDRGKWKSSSAVVTPNVNNE